ncbi:putative T1SS secreted agglutinin RTX [Erwinia phage vB_EamM_Yoloswag]|uniref:Putative T1SS secreted agglutinin RTX n=1 Tax=Erwinia phage vB_EamM_Yoloswag TaxID=1958956 RepID=A0A1S6L380_9CAUD|nr:tail protein [Erwinia phage vB_EamM_Yoloswag]AQT28632.1 putative T1SS secreted agglutinin RTX [Erwinia phage vB_EamM_Yoloswag]
MAVTNIADFAAKYIQLARTRGLTARNPIEFEFRPNANDQTDVYRVVVSMTEPSFADKPYNLLWIDANAGSPQYKFVLIRTSHVSDGNHRGSWMTIDDYSKIFNSKQYYRLVVENASDLGIEAGDVVLPHANTSRLGTVVVQALQDQSAEDARDVQDPVVVSTDDSRMTDARYPLPHDHDDYPRTMIRLNAKDFVEVGSSVAPAAGSVLAIVDRDPTNVNKYIGQWIQPISQNIDWESPRLLNLRLSLPGDASFMSDNSTVKMVATAEWEDRVEQSPEGIVWSIQENVVGVTIDQDGVVTAPDLQTDVVLTVTAKLRDPVYGDWITATYSLLIKNKFVTDDEIVNIRIIGADSMFAAQKETFSVVATFKSGSSSPVVPDNFTSADDALLALTGLTGVAGTARTDTPVKLTATYTYNGVALTAEKTVTIKAQVMTKLEIVGADTINSEASASYTFRVTYSNGKTEIVTPDYFRAEPSTYTVVAANKVTANKEETADRAVNLKAAYTSNGQTIEATKPITIIHATVAPVLSKLEIQGANSIQENNSANYTFLATYSDGTTKTVNPLTFTVDLAQFATIVNKTVTAGSVEQDTKVVLSASYTDNGITKTATLDVNILNVIVVVDLASIKIIGSNSVNQNTTSNYTVLATYTDGSTKTVTPNDFKLTAANQYAQFADGKLTVGAVNVATSSVTISATYIENNITKTATLDVTLVGQAPTIVNLEVRGVDQMNEETASTFECYAIYSDGSEVKVSNPVWTVVQGSAFATIAQTGVLTVGSVTADSSVLLRAASNGLTAQKTVTIKNVIVITLTAAALQQPTPAYAFNDATALAKSLQTILTFSDSSTRDGLASELTYTLAAGDTQTYFELVAPTANTVWQIRTKRVLNGWYGDKTFTVNVVAKVGTDSKSSTAVFTVKGPTDSIATVDIIGPDTVTENSTSSDYSVQITRASGKVETYTATSPTYSLSAGGAYATIVTGTYGYTKKVAVAKDALSADQNATLTVATLTIEGSTYKPTKSIRLLNVASTPVASIVGPDTVNAGQTGTYILRLTYPDTGATEDLTPVTSYGGTGTDTDKVFTYPGNDTIVGNTISATKQAQVKVTATKNGQTYTASKFVTNSVTPVTIDSLVLTGPDSIVGGQNGQYVGTATLSDGTIVDVGTNATWTMQVKSGSITNPLISNSGLLQTGGATVAGVITVTVSYTRNGSTKTATKDVAVSVPSGGGGDAIGARFGVSNKITSAAGYTKAWAMALATQLTTTGEQFIECPAGGSTSGNGKFFYVIWPKSLGYGYFRDYSSGSYGFAGSWDGAQEYDDFNFVGAAEVTIDGSDYIIYRNDFPFDQTYYKYSVVYGSADPLSGQP